MPPKLPKLPRLKLPPSPIAPLREAVRDGVDGIRQAEADIRSLSQDIKEGGAGPPLYAETPVERSGRVPTAPMPISMSAGESSEGTVSDADTYKYQLERIIDDLEHLETEHLPAKGRIANLPCDCVAKASRSLKRHAVETIPIATRQGKDGAIFSEIAAAADKLIPIGNFAAVKSGLHDAEYLEYAGVMSNFRKRVEQLMAECAQCNQAQTLATFIRERRQGA